MVSTACIGEVFVLVTVACREHFCMMYATRCGLTCNGFSAPRVHPAFAALLSMVCCKFLGRIRLAIAYMSATCAVTQL